MLNTSSLLRASTALSSALALSLVAGPASAQTAQSARNAVLRDDLVQKEQALERLAPTIEALAARSDMSVEAFENMLLTDDSMHVDKDGNVLFIDATFVDGDEPSGNGGHGAHHRGGAPGSDIPLSDAFLLHSRPSARRTIYLDFDGHHSRNNVWGHNIEFPAFDRNGDPSTFSNSELQEIIDHWRYMAEDFAPFNVNVTTEEPPVDDLLRSGSGDTRWGVRDVHTQPTDGFGNGIGGVAYLNSFSWSTDTPVFSFNKGSNNGSMTGSHEVGHALGLSHDGLNGSTYHPGRQINGWDWGPIMGAPFGADVVTWSKGDYSGSTTTQNDTFIISEPPNGTNLIMDDHGEAILAGTTLLGECGDLTTAEVCGRITWADDRDAFSFFSDGGPITIDAFPSDPVVGNTDVQLELYGPNGQLITLSNPLRDRTASISTTLAAGVHTIVVDGGEEPGHYTDYGSRGNYTLQVSAPNELSHFRQLGNGLAGGLGEPVLAGDGFGCAGDQVTVSLTNAQPGSVAFLAYGENRLDLPLKGGLLVPDIGGSGSYITLSTDAFGEASVSDLWPAGLASGFRMHFQYWIVDPSGPEGFAASNAMVRIVP